MIWLLVGGALVLLALASQSRAEAIPEPIPPGATGTMATSAIQQLAEGIAKAEGNGLSGAIPTRRNNPGDIVGPDGHIITYPTIEAGWQALYDKLNYDFVTARSSVYSPAMTFRELGWMWVNGTPPDYPLVHSSDQPDAWAATVAAHVGVPIDTTVGDYINGFVQIQDGVS